METRRRLEVSNAPYVSVDIFECASYRHRYPTHQNPVLLPLLRTPNTQWFGLLVHRTTVRYPILWSDQSYASVYETFYTYSQRPLGASQLYEPFFPRKNHRNNETKKPDDKCGQRFSTTNRVFQVAKGDPSQPLNLDGYTHLLDSDA